MDFFSLDIEGAEMAVLKTIPFDKVDIEVFLIEVSIITTVAIENDHLTFVISFEICLFNNSWTTFQTDKTNVTQMTAFMSSVGYEMTPMPPYDHLFIKKY